MIDSTWTPAAMMNTTTPTPPCADYGQESRERRERWGDNLGCGQSMPGGDWASPHPLSATRSQV
jgi:hypothetical protein